MMGEPANPGLSTKWQIKWCVCLFSEHAPTATGYTNYSKYNYQSRRMAVLHILSDL